MLYRWGGTAKNGKWYDFIYNTKARDFGVPFVGILFLDFCHHTISYSSSYVGMLFLTFGLMFLALTTYFKKKGTEARWFHWGFVGLANAYTSIWYTLYTQQWNSLMYRILLLVPTVIAVSVLSSNVKVEERGRGAFIIASLMVYL